MAGLCAPLSTLCRCPRGHLRMTRGRCGSLLLHRDGLAPSTPCRSPGALCFAPESGHWTDISRGPLWCQQQTCFRRIEQVILPDCSQSEWAPMYQILCVLIATIAYGTATGHCQTPQAATTTITFQSATYGDMGQLLARQPAPGAVTVKATLDFPEQTRGHYPAVIVVHTLAGYRDANEGYVAAELRKAGFATLTYDSFAARGTTGTALQGSPGYLTIGVADAHAALRRLAGESRIDAKRVAIIGFSYGAEVAHLTAFEVLRSALNPGPD